MSNARIILGCGLSGLATAITLASNGERVKILEKSKSGGSKFPESIHAFRNYSSAVDELDLIRSRNFSINNMKPIYKIIKFGPSLNPAEMYSRDKPIFYAVKRGNIKESIDNQLIKQAESLQVDFEFNTKGNCKNADIIASGSTFATEIGYGRHYKNVDVDEDTIIFFLNDDYAPKGYAYAIPYGKHEISVVTTSFDPLSFNKMSILFNSLVKNIPIFSGLLKNAEVGPEFAKIGFSFLPQTAKVKKMLLVGEAAGFSEADRGFGMHYALESGFLAAKSLIEGLDYDTLWKASFEEELTKAFKRRLFLNKIGNNQYDQLINSGSRTSTEEYLKYKQNQGSKSEVDINIEIKNLRTKFDITKIFEKGN